MMKADLREYENKVNVGIAGMHGDLASKPLLQAILHVLVELARGHDKGAHLYKRSKAVVAKDSVVSFCYQQPGPPIEVPVDTIEYAAELAHDKYWQGRREKPTDWEVPVEDSKNVWRSVVTHVLGQVELREVTELRSAINGAVLENDRLREALRDEVLAGVARDDKITALVVAKSAAELRLREELERSKGAPVPLEEIEHMATAVRSFYERHGQHVTWLRERMAEALEDGGKLLRLFKDVELVTRIMYEAIPAGSGAAAVDILQVLQTEDK